MFGHGSGMLGTKALAHGAVSSFMTRARGGKWNSGFWAGFAGTMLSPVTGMAKGYYAKVASSAIVAGTVSSITGGKFANGAFSGAFRFMFNEAMKKIKTSFVAFSANITAAFGGEVTVGYYWTNTGENGTFGSVGGTVGIDMGVDVVKGELYGDPNLLDGGFISTSGSIGYIGGGVITDITGNNQIGYFGGGSYSGLLDAGYHQTIGYGWHSRNIPIYESVDNRVTIPSRGF